MNKIEWRNFSVLDVAVAALLICYPVLMFAVKGGMNGCFLALLLISLGVLVKRPQAMSAFVWSRATLWYALSMASLLAAIFLSQSYHQQYSGHPYDGASRFLLAVPVFILLTRVRFSVVAAVQYGFPLAAIAGFLMIKPLSYVEGRYGIITMDLIHFGDFELILGVLSVLSINFGGRDGLVLRLFKTAGFLAGLYASIVSGSRGGWIALPVFLVVFMYFRFGSLKPKAVVFMLFILLTTFLIAYLSSQEIHKRFDETVHDFAIFHHNPDTGTGVRLQLYQAAAEIFVQNPLFGIGPEGFASQMEHMLKAEKLTPLAAELGKGEVHNEILSKASGLGIFGLISILSIYLVPLRIFYCSMQAENVRIKQSGLLGMVFVSGFMIFGLTVEVLNLTMAAAFYALTVAVLLAACCNIHSGDQSPCKSE